MNESGNVARTPSERSRRFPPGLDYAVGLALRLLLLSVAILLVIYVFLTLRLLTVPAVIALLLTTVLEPPARRLRAHGWPALLATWTVLLLAVAALAGIGLLLVPQVVEQFDQVGTDTEQALRDIENWLAEGPLGLSADELDRYVDSAIEQVRTNASALSSQVLDGAFFAVEVLLGVLLALVLTFFFVKDGGRIVDAVLGFVPERRQPLARALGRRAWTTLSAYVRGTAFVGAVNGIVIGIGLAVIGVPLVIPLAVLTFVGAFFPLVGATVAGAVAALVALVSGGVTDALLVVAVVVVVQQLEGDVLSPIVMGRALRLHPLVVIGALTTGAITAGLLGAFLAVPVAALVAGTVSEVRDEPDQPAPNGGGEAAGKDPPGDAGS